MTVQSLVDQLTAAWVWVPGWQDFDPSPEDPAHPSSGRLVTFTRSFDLSSVPSSPALIHLTADTRYKLVVNDVRVCVGPARSDPKMWFYDTIDLAPYLQKGSNTVQATVMRWFKASRAGFPFVRADRPGFTLIGELGEHNLSSLNPGWVAQVDDQRLFPLGFIDDVFLHINERIPSASNKPPSLVKPAGYNLNPLNGDIAPWRLHPRQIPLPEQTPVAFINVHNAVSSFSVAEWLAALNTSSTSSEPSFVLDAGSRHVLDLEAESHSTAFLRFDFVSSCPTVVRIALKLTYSEGYELEPRQYPWLRTKDDRTDPSGLLLGPYDEVVLDVAPGETKAYEPFWFRTFRYIRVELEVKHGSVELSGVSATQTNYPLNAKASWKQEGTEYPDKIWDVSVRTLRNCLFDGYSDCPFYEQLQYSGDARSVGLFHYLISGDDRLMRQAIELFANSYMHLGRGGLTQSRYPSHVPQIIAGFPLYFILSICDHHLYFADRPFALALVPLIDGIFTWFESYVDELGLVSGLPAEVWQYVDWVDTWSADPENGHPDKGVPTAGRKTNRHTYFSMLYAYVLQEACKLLHHVGRPGLVEEYRQRAVKVVAAVQKHCFDVKSGFFTDSTVDVSRQHELPHLSQHCQVFAVLCNASTGDDAARLLSSTFKQDTKTMGKCSYVMLFYAFRALSSLGPSPNTTEHASLYDQWLPQLMSPWQRMIDQHMSTWEEDDVRQRSDCHAWGAVPIYEYSTEIAGLNPIAPGWATISWRPRVQHADALDAKICLGKGNIGHVTWRIEGGKKVLELRLARPACVVVQLPGLDEQDTGVVDYLSFVL